MILANVQSFGEDKQHTEDLVSHVVLSDEVSEYFLVDAGAVRHLEDRSAQWS
jgi:hypothetical protein